MVMVVAVATVTRDTATSLPVSINPGLFVTDSLLDLSMEQALDRNLRPPRDPPTSNKVGLRKTMPGLVELVGAYAAQRHTSRAVVTFGLSDYATTWLESLVVPFSESLTDLRNACKEGGNLDLLRLLNKDDFACGDWPEYGKNGTTTVIVQDGVKGRLGRLSDSIGLSQGALIQYGLAWSWTNSEVSDAIGTVNRCLVPQLSRFKEMVLYTSLQVDILWKLLQSRDGRPHVADVNP